MAVYIACSPISSNSGAQRGICLQGICRREGDSSSQASSSFLRGVETLGFPLFLVFFWGVTLWRLAYCICRFVTWSSCLILLQGTLNKSAVLIAMRWSRVVSNEVVGIWSSSSDSVRISDSGRVSHVIFDSWEAIIERTKLYTRCGVSWCCLYSAKTLVF